MAWLHNWHVKNVGSGMSIHLIFMALRIEIIGKCSSYEKRNWLKDHGTVRNRTEQLIRNQLNWGGKFLRSQGISENVMMGKTVVGSIPASCMWNGKKIR